MVEHAVQPVGREAIREFLGARPVIDADKGIVGGGEADAFRRQPPRQPAVAVAVELQAERRPGRRPQIDQPQLVVQEVEIVMQAFAGVRAHIGLVRLLVMPRLIGVAGLHRRDDMHQARTIAARLKHLGDDRFLADVALGDMLDDDPRLRGQQGRALSHPLAQRRGKLRVVEDPHVPCIKEPRHPGGVAHRRKRSSDHYPVVARQHTGNPVVVAVQKRARHRSLDSSGVDRRYYTLFGSGFAGLGYHQSLDEKAFSRRPTESGRIRLAIGEPEGSVLKAGDVR